MSHSFCWSYFPLRVCTRNHLGLWHSNHRKNPKEPFYPLHTGDSFLVRYPTPAKTSSCSIQRPAVYGGSPNDRTSGYIYPPFPIAVQRENALLYRKTHLFRRAAKLKNNNDSLPRYSTRRKSGFLFVSKTARVSAFMSRRDSFYVQRSVHIPAKILLKNPTNGQIKLPRMGTPVARPNMINPIRIKGP